MRISPTLSILPIIGQRAEAQVAAIVGVVADATSSTPLESANVRVADAGKSTSTLHDGRYSVRISPGSYTIRVARIGYAPAERIIEIGPGQTRVGPSERTHGLHPSFISLSYSWRMASIGESRAARSAG
jgi:hypothetical protein